MPAPTTTDEFLDVARKSGVIDEKRLAAHLERLRTTNQLPSEPLKLATVLVRDGVLTHFQAEQFLQGKWRRFTIGKYKVLERLGSGGMGSVYLCEHMLMRRRVAVKVLPEKKGEDTSSLERFYREARAVAALDHPNIVRAYDIDQDDNLHFLVMEHVDGSSLQEIIKRAGAMDSLRAAHYIRQSALGLQHAHETAGLVHRDVKPGNILVDRNGIVKVLDMGLARFFNDEEDLLTKKYDENVLGTADYLAPEQALDSHSVDIRADIYSLGGTFYYCLTGRTPFAEGTVAQKLIWHQTRQPKPVRQLRADVPEGIAAIVERMMSKSPDDRFQTPQEVADALAPWTQTPIPPPPDSEMPHLSLAAGPRGPASMAETNTRGSTETSPAPRKVWQVPEAPAQPTSQAPAPQPASSRKQQPPPAPPTPAPARTAVSVPPTLPPRLPASPPPSPVPVPTVPSRQVQVAAAPQVQASTPRSDRNLAPAPTAVEELSIEEDLPVDFGVSTPRKPGRSSRSRKKSEKTQFKKSFPGWQIAVGVALLLLLGGIALSYYLIPPTSKTSNDPPPRPILRVDGRASHALMNALSTAGDRTRIVVSGEITDSNLVVNNKRDISIEAEPGTRVLWKCPPAPGLEGANRPKLLLVQASPGLTLQGITFDGNNQTESLIVLYGRCPGMQLADLEFKNSLKNLVLVNNCEGSAEAPVVFSDVRFLTTKPEQSGVHFDISAHSVQSIPVNRFFAFRKCKFDGPGMRMTTLKPEYAEVATIELPGDLRIERRP